MNFNYLQKKIERMYFRVFLIYLDFFKYIFNPKLLKLKTFTKLVFFFQAFGHYVIIIYRKKLKNYKNLKCL